MGNSLTITVGGRTARAANGLLANSVKRAARLGRSLLATGAVSWVVSLF